MDVLATYRSIAARLTGDDGAFATASARHCDREVLAYRHRPTSIGALLEEIHRKNAEKTLIWEGGVCSSYDEVFSRGNRLAAALAKEHGIKAGEPIGIAMRNCRQWFEAFVAVQRLGAIAVLFNSRNKSDELASAATDVRCNLILADDDRAETMRQGQVEATVLSFDAINVLIDGSMHKAPLKKVDDDSPAVVIFTSGTTGRPKGAVLSQFNLTNMAHNLAYSQAINMEMSAAFAGIPLEVLLANRAPMSGLLIAPLFHISGLSVFLVTAMNGGMLSILRRWNPDEALDIMGANRVTTFTGPPLVLADLLALPEAAEKMALIGSFSIAGQATPRGLIDRVCAVLPRTMPSVGWGGTETCGSVSAATGPVFMIRPGSAGIPLPVSEVSVRDDDGQEQPVGRPGELWVRGALVMQGYWNDTAATEASIEQGWYKSGDIGLIDDLGYVHIVDRKKDMVISAGENIYCAEVERVLGTDPDVSEVAVFGIPHPRLGEAAIAAVNLVAGSNRTANELNACAREFLAEYKVPTDIALDLGAFPRNQTGKVEKGKLRALYLASRIAPSA